MAAVALATGKAAAAQGVEMVSGILALEERPGSEHGDVRSAVVYLEPTARGHIVTVANIPELRGGIIAMRGREFIPHVRIVLAGGTVAFPNQDPFSHNVFSNTDIGPFDLGLYRRGATRSATFARSGIYPIYCNIHSKMVSFVAAVPTAMVAQPDVDGRFTIRSVPAGTYVLHAWHERGSSEVRREIVVPPAGSGEPLRVTIDARAYVEAPHLNKFGRPYEMIRADRY